MRDEALRGKIPLVFWDEFDSSLEGMPLGWLRYFLRGQTFSLLFVPMARVPSALRTLVEILTSRSGQRKP